MNTFDNIARTQWFPLYPYAARNTEGLMPGVYEVEYRPGGATYYSYFDGDFWYQASGTPKDAMSNRVDNVRTKTMFIAFRGLAENPNKFSIEIVPEPWVDPKLEHLKDVASDLAYFNVLDENSKMKCVEAAEEIIRDLIEAVESTYETVA